MFNIESIADAAAELGFLSKNQALDRIEITLTEKFVLVFENLRDDHDTMVYFMESDGDWHSHGDLFLGGNKGDLELVGIDILNGIRSGAWILAEQSLPGGGVEKSLVDSSDPFDFSLMDQGEKISFVKL